MAEEDILFGKRRHFFGGIEPSNIKLFEAEEVTLSDGSNAVKLNIVLPDDTVIDDQTVCTVAGAVIRRKINGYPKDEFDGDLVADVTDSGSIIDYDSSNIDIEVDKVACYSAFPYTTQGVYNRNDMNQTHTKSWDIDTVYFNIDTNGLNITISQKFTSYAGFEIRKSTLRFPKDENEGTHVNFTGTSNGLIFKYIDPDVETGQTYYYSIFPYAYGLIDNEKQYYYQTSIGKLNSPTGVMCNTNNIKITVPSYNYLFGFDLDTKDPNPNTRVRYPEDVDNYKFKPSKMDFGIGKFDYGSWYHDGYYTNTFIPRPCMMYYNGTVAYYLDESNYELKYVPSGMSIVDPSSNISNTSFGGNAMMEWPKIYTKRWLDNDGIYHFRCSDTAIDNTWKCWCNYDENGNEIPHFYTSIFNASYNDGKLRSISGTATAVNYSLSNCMDYADNNGTGWNVDRLVDHLLINDLLILIAKTTDLQSAYGNGYANGSSSNALKTGTLNKKGLFWGSNDGSHAVKVFGMENYWGNVSRHIAGWLMVNGVQKIQEYGTFNTDGTNYRTLYNGSVSGIYGYISGMEVLDCGRIPYYASGSSSTYECDKMNVINSSSGTYTATVGGDYEDTSEAGPFAVDIANSPTSSTTAPIGSGLSYKPTAS